MTQDQADRDPLEVLADRFLQEQRQGKCPSISDYANEHPELAEHIRELFPTITAMERLKFSRETSSSGGVFLGSMGLERLGDFRIIREIGRGGMGIVFEAEQQSLGRRVAIKVLPRQSLLRPKDLERFTREARIVASLHHTNIVEVFGVGEEDGFHYYVMQLVHGVGLEKVIAELGSRRRRSKINRRSSRTVAAATTAAGAKGKHDSTSIEQVVSGLFSLDDTPPESETGPSEGTSPAVGAVDANKQLDELTGESDDSAGTERDSGVAKSVFSAMRAGRGGEFQLGRRYFDDVAKIGLQVADALAHAHSRGILHRDIKPANLLIDYHNIVYVTDFGLAKAVQAGDTTQTAGITGTLRYISPEQFQGHTDARSDIYGLGLTLYELLALRPAYEGPDRNTLINRINTSEPVRLGKLNRKIPRDLETIVQKAISRDPDDRYQCVRELGEDLKCFLEDMPIRARRVGSIERFWRWSRRNPAIASLTGATMFLIILAAIVATAGYVNTNRALEGREIERKRAQANADLAVKALNRMFERFNPNQITSVSGLTVDKGEGVTMLTPAPPVLSGEVAVLLKDMLTFYRRIANTEPYDPALRQRVAKANERVGSIRQLLGLYNLAISSYKQAINIYRMRYSDTAQESSFMLEVARVYNSLGQLYLSTGKMSDACASHLGALWALQPDTETISDRSAIRYELARTHYLLGSGGYDDLGDFSLNEEQDSPSTGEPSQAGELSLVYINRPDLEARQRKSDVHLQTAIDILEGLLSENADNPDYHLMAALCHRNMSSILSQGDPYVAGGSLATATGILEKLAFDHPEMPDYRYHLAETYATFDLKSDPSESYTYQLIEDRLNKAVAISEGLAAEYPYIPRYTVSQAHIYHKMGTVMKQTMRWDEAAKNYRKSIGLYEALVGRFPDTVPYKIQLAAFRITLTDLLVRDQRLAEARSILEDSIEMLIDTPLSNNNRFPVDELLAQTRQAFELAGGENTQTQPAGDGSGILAE